ncbi:ZIP family metal transporter [Halocola ammonii]
MLLSFSGAFLLGLCVVHLLPTIFNSELQDPGLFILAGFFIQILLEYLSRGLEHGHIHHEDASGNIPWVLMISLSLHAFIEGMPFGHNHAHGHDHLDALLFGVVLHKAPVAIVLMTLFTQAKFSKVKSLVALLVFSLMAPLGAVSFGLFERSSHQLAEIAMPAVTAVLVGILLHIATTILFETSDGHHFNRWKFASIVLGVFLAWWIG